MSSSPFSSRSVPFTRASRFAALIACLALVAAGLLLGGCDSSGDDDEETNAVVTPEEIGVSVDAENPGEEDTRYVMTITNNGDGVVDAMLIEFRLKNSIDGPILEGGEAFTRDNLQPGESVQEYFNTAESTEWNCYEYTIQLAYESGETFNENFPGQCV